MKIIEINEGAKIPYEVDGTKICFDDDLTVNLAKRQEDWATHIDLCSDKDGSLVIGAPRGNFYVAQIDIPAREYEETEVVDEHGEQIDGDTQPAMKVERKPIPLNMDNVTLTLWALENYSE